MCSARTPKRAATAMRRIGKIRGRGFFKYPHRCLKWHSHRRWLHFHNRLPQVRVRQQRLIHFAIAGCIRLGNETLTLNTLTIANQEAIK